MSRISSYVTDLEIHQFLQLVIGDGAALEGRDDGGVGAGEAAGAIHGKVTLNGAKLACRQSTALRAVHA